MSLSRLAFAVFFLFLFCFKAKAEDIVVKATAYQEKRLHCSGKVGSEICEITLFFNACLNKVHFRWSPLKWPGTAKWAKEHRNYCSVVWDGQRVRDERKYEAKRCDQIISLFEEAFKNFPEIISPEDIERDKQLQKKWNPQQPCKILENPMDGILLLNRKPPEAPRDLLREVIRPKAPPKVTNPTPAAADTASKTEAPAAKPEPTDAPKAEEGSPPPTAAATTETADKNATAPPAPPKSEPIKNLHYFGVSLEELGACKSFDHRQESTYNPNVPVYRHRSKELRLIHCSVLSQPVYQWLKRFTKAVDAELLIKNALK